MQPRPAPPRRRHRFLLGVLLAASHACSRDAPAASTGDAAASSTALRTDAAVGALPREVAPQVDVGEASALVQRWVEAQNRGDYDAYAELYASKFFGVKRAGERETRYAREAWLADRQRMFRKAIRVETRDLVVRPGTSSAQVELVQRFASGNFADEGPKRLLVVREAGTLKIAQEEMLASLETAPPAHGSNALDLHFVLPLERGLYMVVDADDAPAATGPVRRERALDDDGTVWTTSRALPDEALDPALRAWKGTRVRLDDGCTAVVTDFVALGRVDPHFGNEQTWSGTDGDPPVPPLSPERQAEEAFALAPKSVAARLQGCQRGIFAQRASTVAPIHAERIEDDDLTRRARAAFAKLPDVTAHQKELIAQVESAPGAWWASSLEITIHRHPVSRQTLVSAHARWSGESCADFSATVRAFFELRGKALVPLRATSAGGEVVSVLDANQDGRLELLLRQVDLGTDYQLLSPDAGGPDAALTYSYQDCPC